MEVHHLATPSFAPHVKAIAGVCVWVPLILLVYTIENQQLKKFELINEIKTY